MTTRNPHRERLAKLFPDFGKVEQETDWSLRLQHNTDPNMGLFVITNKPGKFVFSGCFLHDFQTGGHYHPQSPVEVSVSQSRDDASIAKDVQKRLIDWYVTELPKHVAKRDADLSADNKRIASMKRLAEMFDGRISDTSSHCIDMVGVHELQVNHDGSEYRIKTYNLPVEKIIKILNIIKGKE